MKKTVFQIVKDLEETCQEKYGIGLHGVNSNRFGNEEEITQRQIAESILSTGIRINNGYKNLRSTIHILGRIKGKDHSPLMQDTMENYSFGFDNAQCNVIVASPVEIENSKGEKIYLGFPKSERGYDQNTVSSFIDVICAEQRNIPPELIYGYYYNEGYGTIQKDDFNSRIQATAEKVDFVPNPRHYSRLSDQERDEFFDRIEQELKKDYILFEQSKAFSRREYDAIDITKRFPNLKAFGISFPEWMQEEIEMLEREEDIGKFDLQK